MKIIKAVIILLALFTFMPIKAISINEVNGPISNEVWQSVANKLRFCYDKNLYRLDCQSVTLNISIIYIFYIVLIMY